MLSNDGYAEKEWTLIKVLLSLLVIIGILSLIEIETLQPNDGNDPANDHSNVVLLFVRMQDGQLHPFEVSASANLHDVHEAVEGVAGHAVTLTFRGETLLNDESVSIADVGIGPECVIDASPNLNDLQILERAVENPNVNLWSYLVQYELRYMYIVHSKKIRDILRGIHCYQSLEDAAQELSMDVFKFTTTYFTGSITMDEATGKIHGFQDRKAPASAVFDLNVLSELTELNCLLHRIEVASSEIYLKGLDKMKKLGIAELYFHCNEDSPSEVRVIFPDMSECKELSRIRIHHRGEDSVLLNIDCTESNLEYRQIRTSEHRNCQIGFVTTTTRDCDASM